MSGAVTLTDVTALVAAVPGGAEIAANINTAARVVDRVTEGNA